MGFSLGGILLAGWNHVLGGFGVFDRLSFHISASSCLCSLATYACVLYLGLSGNKVEPDLASLSATFLPTIPMCPGHQLMPTMVLSSALRMLQISLLTPLEWPCAFPELPFKIP